MKMTPHSQWTEDVRLGFGGAGPKAKMYETKRGMAVAQPAEEFKGELISVELFLEVSVEEPVRFLAPDWDTAEFLIESLIE